MVGAFTMREVFWAGVDFSGGGGVELNLLLLSNAQGSLFFPRRHPRREEGWRVTRPRALSVVSGTTDRGYRGSGYYHGVGGSCCCLLIFVAATILRGRLTFKVPALFLSRSLCSRLRILSAPLVGSHRQSYSPKNNQKILFPRGPHW